jgi:hypothetical protein
MRRGGGPPAAFPVIFESFDRVAMTPNGICPKCQKLITRIVISRVEAGAEMGGATFGAMTLQCPACNTVLGAQLERRFDDAGTQPRGVNESQGNTSH